ncbi:MAG: hypothetical protein ABSH20_11380 [Tepidisphaeraceae bacterium]|jgi:hypothetical protein
MSTSLLYRVWGLRGYRLVRTRFETGRVWFGIEHEEAILGCAHCGSTRTEKPDKDTSSQPVNDHRNDHNYLKPFILQ